MGLTGQPALPRDWVVQSKVEGASAPCCSSQSPACMCSLPPSQAPGCWQVDFGALFPLQISVAPSVDPNVGV